MTVEEAKKMIEELKAQGNSEEDIVSGFYMMFCDGDIDVNELGDLVQLVGYELTEEFKNMSLEDQKKKGWDEDEDISKEEIEDAKEIEEEPAKEEKKESESESESDEEKARKLFGY